MPIFRRNHSCGLSMVELEQSAEPFPTSDCAISGNGACAAIDQGVCQALMVSFEMVVSHVFRDRQSKVALSQRNQSFKTLALDRKHKAFRKGIGVSRRLHLMGTIRVKLFG